MRKLLVLSILGMMAACAPHHVVVYHPRPVVYVPPRPHVVITPPRVIVTPPRPGVVIYR